jgi:pimeloyl-ACP methyl ester carboxylesterase
MHARSRKREGWAWRPEARQEADRYISRVVAVDLPGFGEARVAPGEQAPWNDVLETMAGLGLERAALAEIRTAWPGSTCRR